MATDEVLEDEIDYLWHPTDEEYTSEITSQMWAELFQDPAFTSTDAYKSIICLRDYGAPATFQQLSIRYRAAMGRYRRWLSDAARTACQRFGIAAPSKDQFGMDEWWPVLYQTRATGKPGAGIFEMQLRDEVLDAFQTIEEEQKKERRAEKAQQLQYIEQLERRRQEERARAAEEAKKATEAKRPRAVVTKKQETPQATEGDQKKADERQTATTAENHQMSSPQPVVAPQAPQAAKHEGLTALREFLELVDRPWMAENLMVTDEAFDGSIDYAGRYASRLQQALLELMVSDPALTEATLARALGDPSVEHLQAVLSGKAIPEFSYLDRIAATLFVGTMRLEASDANVDAYPMFVTYAEVHGTKSTAQLAKEVDAVTAVRYVVDDSPDRRTVVVMGFGAGRACLLSRVPVASAGHRGQSPELDAFMRLVDEIDSQIANRGVTRTSTQVSGAEFAQLIAGSTWPGTLLP